MGSGSRGAALLFILAASVVFLLLHTTSDLRVRDPGAGSSLRALRAADAVLDAAAVASSTRSTAAAAAAATVAAPAVSTAASSNKTVHKLCVLSRVHNQPRSLAEWLEYHAALGVSRFYLVDDCSSDGGRTRTVMDVYEQEGPVRYFTPEDVTRRQCTHVVRGREGEAARYEQRRLQRLCRGADEQQEAAAAPLDDEAAKRFERDLYTCSYKCSAEEHKPEERRLFEFLFEEATSAPDETCEWLMVFDTDEYMTFQTDLFPTPDVLAYFAHHEQRTNGFPIVRFPWVMMGSQGQEARPPGLMVENFVEGGYPRWMLKTAAKAAFVRTWDFSHWPRVVDVSNATSVAAHGFEIPAPFESLKDYTERNTQELDSEVMMRVQTVSQTDGTQAECVLPAAPVFLKHYFYRSFEEFKAHRSDTVLKSDGAVDKRIMADPWKAWEKGTHPGLYGGPCNRSYANDFTALMAERTRANLAARRRAWDARRSRGWGWGWGWERRRQAGLDFEKWIRAGECGSRPAWYNGPFPPVEEWII